MRAAIFNDNLFFMIAGAQNYLDDCLYYNEDRGPGDYCLFKRVIILTRVRIVRYRQSSVAYRLFIFYVSRNIIQKKENGSFRRPKILRIQGKNEYIEEKLWI